jgi:hypothetical protein
LQRRFRGRLRAATARGRRGDPKGVFYWRRQYLEHARTFNELSQVMAIPYCEATILRDDETAARVMETGELVFREVEPAIPFGG